MTISLKIRVFAMVCFLIVSSLAALSILFRNDLADRRFGRQSSFLREEDPEGRGEVPHGALGPLFGTRGRAVEGRPTLGTRPVSGTGERDAQRRQTHESARCIPSHVVTALRRCVTQVSGRARPEVHPLGVRFLLAGGGDSRGGLTAPRRAGPPGTRAVPPWISVA